MRHLIGPYSPLFNLVDLLRVLSLLRDRLLRGGSHVGKFLKSPYPENICYLLWESLVYYHLTSVWQNCGAKSQNVTHIWVVCQSHYLPKLSRQDWNVTLQKTSVCAAPSWSLFLIKFGTILGYFYRIMHFFQSNGWNIEYSSCWDWSTVCMLVWQHLLVYLQLLSSK
jgi:hypothetical protein